MQIQRVAILIGCIALTGCGEPTNSDDSRTDGEVLVGSWKSEYSRLVFREDGTFEFTPLIEGDKSRGRGVWEESKDGGIYLRYRADKPNEYHFSGAEYFRIIEAKSTFFHIDSHETFSRVTEDESEPQR